MPPRTRTPRPRAPSATEHERSRSTVARAPAPLHTKLGPLTEGILDLLGDGYDGRARIEIGKLLSQIHAGLDQGQWLRWLDREVPFGPPSARNYIDLATWAEARPALFAKLAPLGSSKLYVIMRLPDHVLGKLLARKTLLVPSSGLELPLGRMSLEQFLEAVAHLDRSPRIVLTPPQKALKSSLRHARSLVRDVAVIIEHPNDVPLEAVDELHDTLVTALAELLEHFDLD